ncbi:hypothetical protein PLICRDRAFT_171545 [Plicaturopsis crispa FD-325 SS-3]|nr:hypothetical protein PLICRDRAFT_171545 [Plicaturopsis crispa FD-325 SS-3]
MPQLLREFAPIFEFPAEMFMYLCIFLPRGSIINLMKTCIWLFKSCAPYAYETIIISTPNDARCLGVMLNPRNEFVDYAVHVRDLTYNFNWGVDILLAFPRLCEALRRAHNLTNLHLSASKHTTPFLVTCLQRYGLFAASSSEIPYAFPYLRKLRRLSVTCSRGLAELVVLRNLPEFSLGIYSALEFKQWIKPMILRSGYHHQTLTISLMLTASTDIDVALPEIFTHFPSMTSITVQQGTTDPMIVLTQFCNTKSFHVTLRTVSINVCSEPVLYMTPIGIRLTFGDLAQQLHLQQKLLNNITGMYPSIETVRFGPHTWRLDPRAEMWTPEPSSSTVCWWTRANINRKMGEVSKLIKGKPLDTTRDDILRFWDIEYPL